LEYFEIPARSILNRTKPNMPFGWTSTPTGAANSAAPTAMPLCHEFMELDPAEFEDKIYAQSCPGHLLRQELSRLARGHPHRIGTLPTPTSPPSAAFERTRAILEVSLARAAGTGHHH